MRVLSLIVIHCSSSDNIKHDNLETISKWHTDRGFDSIGYHFIITKDGKLHQGRPLEQAGAHCEGYNSSSIGICLTGNHVFSTAQFDTLKAVCRDMMLLYHFDKTDIVGHELLDKKGKTCPNFNWREFVATL